VPSSDWRAADDELCAALGVRVITDRHFNNPIAAALRAEPRCPQCGWNEPECRCSAGLRIDATVAWLSAKQRAAEDVGTRSERERDQSPHHSDSRSHRK
jgi:hypothetical protein